MLTLFEFALETLQDGVHRLAAPVVFAFCHIYQRLGYDFEVDTQLLLLPACGDILADGVGCRIVEGVDFGCLFLFQFGVGVVKAFFQQIVLLFHFAVGVGLLLQLVVVGLVHSRFATFDGDIGRLGQSRVELESNERKNYGCKKCFFHLGIY